MAESSFLDMLGKMRLSVLDFATLGRHKEGPRPPPNPEEILRGISAPPGLRVAMAAGPALASLFKVPNYKALKEAGRIAGKAIPRGLERAVKLVHHIDDYIGQMKKVSPKFEAAIMKESLKRANLSKGELKGLKRYFSPNPQASMLHAEEAQDFKVLQKTIDSLLGTPF